MFFAWALSDWKDERFLHWSVMNFFSRTSSFLMLKSNQNSPTRPKSFKNVVEVTFVKRSSNVLHSLKKSAQADQESVSTGRAVWKNQIEWALQVWRLVAFHYFLFWSSFAILSTAIHIENYLQHVLVSDLPSRTHPL